MSDTDELQRTLANARTRLAESDSYVCALLARVQELQAERDLAQAMLRRAAQATVRLLELVLRVANR